MKLIYYVFAITLCFAACSKSPLTPPPTEKEEPEPEKDGDDDDDNENESPQELYTIKQGRNSVIRHYTASDINQDLYLGSLWHLQDTTDKVILEKQKFPFPLFECALFFEGPGILSTTAIPSFKAMRDYIVAAKPAIGSQASAGSGSSFDDYALIKGILPDNVDRQKFLALATVNDSTVIRKPYSSSFNGEIATHMNIDFTDMADKMSDDDRKAMQAMNKSLYMVSSVAYGKKYVIMVESDSVRGSINSAFRKLIGRESLDKTDEETVAASKMLLYYRGGKKESLVAKADGKEDILTLINTFHQEWDDKNTQYDYPLYYYLMKDAFGVTLRYDNTYEYLVKNK
ncbi:hypothetical protein [Sphingobacterium haloxyli]|uniref:Thiol-activated cytolysin n=1 Tax=Sphingobacterium haloxyli TaxID=2100533 RepID=A0A2S9IY72_9SPHI|nr:hypothetical protein [Sphingobacterium haloxyli]PRD45482.1 hypothetical protein C5745_17990 [Sphingobacterium haloxyli]